MDYNFNNGLFEADKDFPGIRLHTQEIYNWGTFDHQVCHLDFNRESMLLTGENGTGKTTFLDAIQTMLVKNPKYNISAENQGRSARNKTSYVRGCVGKNSIGETSEAPRYLREPNEITILLLVVGDGIGNENTIINLLCANKRNNSENEMTRSYFILPGRFGIEKDILYVDDTGKSIATNSLKGLKERIRKLASNAFYSENFEEYTGELCKTLNVSDKALKSICKTLSVRSISNTDKFIMDWALDEPTSINAMNELQSQIGTLKDLMNQIQMHTKRLKILEPLVNKYGAEYTKYKKEYDEITQLHEAVPAWLNKLEIELGTTELKEQEILKTQKETEEKEETEKLNENEKQLEKLKSSDIMKQETQLNNELAELRNQLNNRERHRNNMENHAKPFGLKMPNRRMEFDKFLADIAEKTAIAQGMQNQLEIAIAENEKIIKDLLFKKKNLSDEIQHLENQKGNIDHKIAIVRENICRDLKIKPSELPYIGELLEVPKEEAEWEGAINKLLHTYSLSMLVPEKYYKEVKEWVEHKLTKAKITYYPVQNESVATDNRINQDKETVCGKLRIKSNAPMTQWLKERLIQRFPHVCCNITELDKISFGLTKTGQFKDKSGLHTRDERRKTQDSRYYTLGFTNERKLKSVQKEYEETCAEYNKINKELENDREQNKQCATIISEAKTIKSDYQWEDIDTGSVSNAIYNTQKTLDEIKAKNDGANSIRLRIEQLEKAKKETKANIKSIQEEIGKIIGTIDNIKQRLDSIEDIDIPEDTIKKIINFTGNPNLKKRRFTYFQRYKDDTNTLFTTKLNEINDPNSKINIAKNRLKQQMEQYLNENSFARKTLYSDVEYMPQFQKEYENLKADNMIKVEEYEHLYKKDFVKFFSTYHHSIQASKIEIESSIDNLNNVLSKIYLTTVGDKKIYLKIRLNETNNVDIKEFQKKLNESIRNADAPGENMISEKSMQSVTELLEYFNTNTYADNERKKKLTDVRLWYDYKVQKIFEDGTEYDFISNTSANSGGEQESLAAFIMIVSQAQMFKVLEPGSENSFRFIMLDEAIRNLSYTTGQRVLELLKELQFQCLYVTPFTNVARIQPFVGKIAVTREIDAEHRTDVMQVETKKERYANETNETE